LVAQQICAALLKVLPGGATLKVLEDHYELQLRIVQHPPSFLNDHGSNPENMENFENGNSCTSEASYVCGRFAY